MTALTLRLYEDHLPAGCPAIYLSRLPRALYVRDGSVMADDESGGRLIEAGQGHVHDGGLSLVAGQADTLLWRWELEESARAPSPALPSAPATSSRLLLEQEVDLDRRFDWLMRCDRVDFPPGGVALTHVHQGPGIRIVHHGQIAIETLGQRHVHNPGEAWFELGHAPVLAPTTEDGPTAFVRCFLLPRALKGVSSIRYVRPEDARAPKVQEYRVFAERFISLPD
ncbi:hypothetical protein SAMN05428989_3997 [Pseudoxanthomonas sp. GM95]|uniref:hypothetical protein n=1 Tax=Pseudoxanthomonas sp. GM95 TaxID=1881043 RepID=UPI0008CCECF3|nr:hypothetical protein [Pseudoxanthomonas sp. GM95]SEM52659.1 hypothetical protein SAMN05428989_3997 [Pseudoxanthomonas sp. GM95]